MHPTCMITANSVTCTAGVDMEVCSEGMSTVQFNWIETTPQMWYKLDDIKVTKATQGPHI